MLRNVNLKKQSNLGETNKIVWSRIWAIYYFLGSYEAQLACKNGQDLI